MRCVRRWWGVGLSVFGLLLFAGGEPAVAAPAADETESESDEKSTAEPELTLDWYGYIKLDASWDESLIDSGNFARWAVSPSLVEEHPHFNMTARQTRLGANLNRSPDNGLAINAKLEIDFYGGGAENKNRPQLRHAYFDLVWPERNLVLRAGQASDVISPLVPTTLNYTVAWWVGNIGYRRPLAAVTKTLGAEGSGKTKLTAAISRSIGDDFGAVEPGDSGADSGQPTVQAALSRSFSLSGRDGRFGFSGHWGAESLHEEMGEPKLDVDSWSANLDFILPMGSRTVFKGEAWTGENLDDYFGGIAQGVNFQSGEVVAASGGWATVEFRPVEKVLTSVGFGMDDPDDEALARGGRSRNQAIWTNVLWNIRPVLTFGLEASWWDTEYVELDDGSSMRLQASLIYRFAK